MLKKGLSILVLIVVLFNMTGFFVIFKIEQYQIRKEIKTQIKAGIPQSDLHKFSLSNHDYQRLEWIRQDIEFKSGINMFDIVRSEQFSDSIYLYCVNDIEEATLFAQLDEMVKDKKKKESDSPDSATNTLAKLFNLFQYVEYVQIKIAFGNENEKPNCVRKPIFYSSPFMGLEIPPPDKV